LEIIIFLIDFFQQNRFYKLSASASCKLLFELSTTSHKKEINFHPQLFLKKLFYKMKLASAKAINIP
jgi:hypothetical protein